MKVINSSDTYSSYVVKGISLEYDMVTDSELARQIRDQYAGRMAILYDRVLRHRKITKNKSDALWNINLNVPARNMKGILMLFEDPSKTNTETYYNPKIIKVEMTTEGIPNQLFSQGMQAHQQWNEINRYFALTSKRDKVTDKVAEDLYFSDTNIEQYLTTRYALWLDLRSKSIKWNFIYLFVYNIRCTNQFRRWKIQRSCLLICFTNLLIHEVKRYKNIHIVPLSLIVKKTEFVLDLLESEYAGVFQNIVIMCPTIHWNKAYKYRSWIDKFEKDKNITTVNPIMSDGKEKLQELLRLLLFFFYRYAGKPTLYIIDDCSATKKKDMLSELAFSGRHAEQSVCVISQRYNSVLKDLSEQTKWVCMFYTKDIVLTIAWDRMTLFQHWKKKKIKEELSKVKHRKLILKTTQPTDYWLVD